MRKRWRVVLLVGLIPIIGAIFTIPSVYWPTYGLLTGESVWYQGMPAPYWKREAQEFSWLLLLPERHDRASSRHSLWMRRRTAWEQWCDRIRGISVESRVDTTPLLQGDPTALPVLTILAQEETGNVSRMAAEGIQRIHLAGHDIRPAVVTLRASCREVDGTSARDTLQHLERLLEENQAK
jgi:hypothetical protein